MLVTEQGYIEMIRAVCFGEPEDVDDFFDAHFDCRYRGVAPNGHVFDYEGMKAQTLRDRQKGFRAYPTEVKWLLQQGNVVAATSFGVLEGPGMPSSPIEAEHLMELDESGTKFLYNWLIILPLKDSGRFNPQLGGLTEKPIPRVWTKANFAEYLSTNLKLKTAAEVAEWCERELDPGFVAHVSHNSGEVQDFLPYLKQMQQSRATMTIELLGVSHVLQQGNRLAARSYFSFQSPGGTKERHEILHCMVFSVRDGKCTMLEAIGRTMSEHEEWWPVD